MPLSANGKANGIYTKPFSICHSLLCSHGSSSHNSRCTVDADDSCSNIYLPRRNQRQAQGATGPSFLEICDARTVRF